MAASTPLNDSDGRVRPLVLALLLCLGPAAILAPALVFLATYHPWDPAAFPPASAMLDDATRTAMERAPSNYDVTEIPGLVVPELELARAELLAGRAPTWNPYARFGAPLFANGLAAMGQPINTLFLLLFDPRAGLAWRSFAMWVFAGFFAYRLFRRLGTASRGAVFGAIVFQLGGSLAANAPFYMRFDPLAFSPLLLGATLAIFEPREHSRRSAALALCAGIALTMLAGFPPYAVASVLLTAAFALAIGAMQWTRRERRRDVLPAFLVFGGSIALGIALAAFQLAPMFAFFPESNRRLLPSTSAILTQGFDVAGFLGLLLPNPFGHPSAGDLPAHTAPLALLTWQRRDPTSGDLVFPLNFGVTEYALFLGSLSVPLILAGFAKKHSTGARALGVAAVLVLILALAPAFLAFAYRLPVLASVQPLRLLAPLTLVLAFLAGTGFEVVARRERTGVPLLLCGLCIGIAMVAFGTRAIEPLTDPESVQSTLLQRFRSPSRPTLDLAAVEALVPATQIAAAAHRLRESLFHTGLGALLAAAFLALSLALRGRSRDVLLWLAVLGTIAELVIVARPFNPTRRLVDDPTATPIHDFLRERNEAMREAGGLVLARAAPTARDPLVLPPGLLFPLRLRDLNSYAFVDGRSHRVFLEIYGPGQMIRAYWPRSFPDDPRLSLPFFDLCGLRFVVSDTELAHAGTRVGPTTIGPRAVPFWIYERASALPRAFVVHALREVADDDDAVRVLASAELSPRREALVDPQTRAALATANLQSPAAQARRVRFLRDDPTAIDLSVDAGPAGLLVLADSMLAGWTARVDGEDVDIHRVNLFQRGVAIGAGEVRVEFRYAAPLLGVGTTVTGLALCALCWLAARSRRSSAAGLRADPAA
jgi:hypothetical protein